MDFFQVMGVLILAGLGITYTFFKKGGMYNREMTSLDREPPDEPFVPASPPPVMAPSKPKTPVSAPSTSMDSESSFILFCTAIRDFEGKPGDQSYRLNNPGNCRYNPDGYLPKYGKVEKSKNGFAIFSTYELGWLYLTNMLRGQIHKRPNLTILEFMHRYAPPEDSNPTENYAKYIGTRLGVNYRTYRVRDLV